MTGVQLMRAVDGGQAVLLVDDLRAQQPLQATSAWSMCFTTEAVDMYKPQRILNTMVCVLQFWGEE